MSIKDRTLVQASLAMAMLFAIPTAALADAFIYTPPIITVTTTAVCRVLNTNTASVLTPVGITVDFFNADFGTVVSGCGNLSWSFTATNTSHEFACPSVATLFCRVTTASTTTADGMVVNVFQEDSNGTAQGVVRGMRVPTLAPSNLSAAGMTTGGLTAGGNQYLECAFVNTGPTVIPATGRLIADDGTVLATNNLSSLGTNHVGYVVSPTVTPPAGATCVAESDTNAHAKQLRASLYSLTNNGFYSDSLSPIGNP